MTQVTKTDRMRARIFKILHGLDLRAALQNIKQLMQLNEIFTLTSNFPQKVSREDAIANDL